jgi:hypothetical protein
MTWTADPTEGKARHAMAAMTHFNLLKFFRIPIFDITLLGLLALSGKDACFGERIRGSCLPLAAFFGLH